MKRTLLILAVIASSVLCASAQKKMSYTIKTIGEIHPTRTEIILPQVKGFNCYKGDFHVHTAYSDGVVSPSGRVLEAWVDGLDILAITDHYESLKGVGKALKVSAPYNEDGKPKPFLTSAKTGKVTADFNAIHKEAAYTNKQKSYGMLLIKGCEMARSKLGHYNALFVKDLNTLYDKDLEVAFRNVHKQGGIVVHNHPGNISKYENEWHKKVYNEGLIDGVEVVNGFNYYPPMVNRCLEKGLTMFGNTDIHNASSATQYAAAGCFRTMTFVFAKELTEKAIRDAILKHRTIAYSGGCLIGEEEWLTAFFNAAVECRMVQENSENGNRRYILINNSSIPFTLRKGGSAFVLEPFKSTLISVGKDKKSGKPGIPTYRIENMWHADQQHPTIQIEIDK